MIQAKAFQILMYINVYIYIYIYALFNYLLKTYCMPVEDGIY